jgi:hypothetical protein
MTAKLTFTNINRYLEQTLIPEVLQKYNEKGWQSVPHALFLGEILDKTYNKNFRRDEYIVAIKGTDKKFSVATSTASRALDSELHGKIEIGKTYRFSYSTESSRYKGNTYYQLCSIYIPSSQ